MEPGQSWRPSGEGKSEEKDLETLIARGTKQILSQARQDAIDLGTKPEQIRHVLRFEFGFPQGLGAEQIGQALGEIQRRVLTEIGVTDEQLERAKTMAASEGVAYIRTNLDQRIYVQVQRNNSVAISVNEFSPGGGPTSVVE